MKTSRRIAVIRRQGDQTACRSDRDARGAGGEHCNVSGALDTFTSQLPAAH
jgi:hypothetical protein